MTNGLPARLSWVTIGTRDVPGLRAFYQRLGWPTAAEAGDDFAAFHLGGVMLSLYRVELLMEEAAPGVEPGGAWSGVTLACNLDTRDAVDTTYAAWLAAGATAVTEPVDRDWGGRTGYVADPEGNRWEIAWNPATVFNEHGAVTPPS